MRLPGFFRVPGHAGSAGESAAAAAVKPAEPERGRPEVLRIRR